MKYNLTVTKGLKSEIYTPTTPPPVWTPMTKPLSECKVGLASAAGVHPKNVKPFGTSGDSTYREVPVDIPADQLMVTHGGYDNSDVNKDINCMFPYERLKELAASGFIKAVAERNFGFMGGGGVQTEFREYVGPSAAKLFKEQNVDCVILTAG